ncbi:MAG: hypothetical protein PHG02_05360 [Oscillospiraceae bacterium]|nr:hypothetical protein [Oscillospiraceae bacterium]
MEVMFLIVGIGFFLRIYIKILGKLLRFFIKTGFIWVLFFSVVGLELGIKITDQIAASFPLSTNQYDMIGLTIASVPWLAGIIMFLRKFKVYRAKRAMEKTAERLRKGKYKPSKNQEDSELFKQMWESLKKCEQEENKAPQTGSGTKQPDASQVVKDTLENTQKEVASESSRPLDETAEKVQGTYDNFYGTYGENEVAEISNPSSLFEKATAKITGKNAATSPKVKHEDALSQEINEYYRSVNRTGSGTLDKTAEKVQGAYDNF